MKRSTIGLSCAAVLFFAACIVTACAEGTDGEGSGGSTAKGGAAGANAGGSAGSQQGGSAGTAQGGNGGNLQGGSAGSAQGGSGEGGSAGAGEGGSSGGGHAGEGGGGGTCTAPGAWATVQDVAMGTATLPHVWIDGAVAETPMVLTYKSGGGNCLWAVFVRDSSQPYATMVISYGDPAPKVDGGFGDCPKTGTIFPDNVAPGDKLVITGDVSPYAPTGCTQPKQVQINACQVTRTSSGTAPAPVTVQPADVMSGAAKYQGLLVKIENVDAQMQDGGTVGDFGVIKLQGSGLEVHDKFYYREDGPPVFGANQHFASISGVVHLDYCTWALQPVDKCKDFDPKSTDCP